MRAGSPWNNDEQSFQDFLNTGIPHLNILRSKMGTIFVNEMILFSNDRYVCDRKQNRQILNRLKSNVERTKNLFFKTSRARTFTSPARRTRNDMQGALQKQIYVLYGTSAETDASAVSRQKCSRFVQGGLVPVLMMWRIPSFPDV